MSRGDAAHSPSARRQGKGVRAHEDQSLRPGLSGGFCSEVQLGPASARPVGVSPILTRDSPAGRSAFVYRFAERSGMLNRNVVLASVTTASRMRVGGPHRIETQRPLTCARGSVDSKGAGRRYLASDYWSSPSTKEDICPCMTMEVRGKESRASYGRLRRIGKTKLAATLCA
jgi:hypothetical protein